MYFMIPFFGFVCLMIFLAFLSERRTIESIQQLARDKGFTYNDSQDLGTLLQVLSYRPVGPVRHTLQGVRDQVEFTIGRMTVQMPGIQQSKQTVDGVMFILSHPGIDLPSMQMRTEIPHVDALLSHLGQQDVNFPEDPEFSKAFVVGGANEERIREYLDENKRRVFLEWNKRGPWKNNLVFFAGNGSRCVIHPQAYLHVAQWLETLDAAVMLVQELAEAEA